MSRRAKGDEERELLRSGESKRREVPRKLEEDMSSDEGHSGPKSIAEWNESHIDDSGLCDGVNEVLGWCKEVDMVAVEGS